MPNQAERLRTGQNALYYKLCQDKNVRRLLHKMWNDFSYPAAWTHCWSQEMNLWFFFLLWFFYFSLLALRFVYFSFVTRAFCFKWDTSVMFQWRRVNYVCFTFLQCFSFFSFSLHFFQDTTTPGWDLLILELLFSITLKSCDRTFILFSFYVEGKKVYFSHWIIFIQQSDWKWFVWSAIRKEPAKRHPQKHFDPTSLSKLTLTTVLAWLAPFFSQSVSLLLLPM